MYQNQGKCWLHGFPLMAACVEDLRRDSCDLAVKREECMQRRKMRSIFHPFVTDLGVILRGWMSVFSPLKVCI